MPICAICEEVVNKVYRCMGCGIDFCRDCGDPNSKKKLCDLCSRYEAEDEEWLAEEWEEKWEDAGEGEEWWEEEEW